MEEVMEKTNITNHREYYVDNIRSGSVVLVIVYHVVYLFNSVGVIKNIAETGIPIFDTLCYFVYPWMMTLMFLIAGMSARYALQKRTGKQFLKERVQKLLMPFLGGMFLLAWIIGWVTNKYVDFFGGQYVNPIIKYFIFCLNIGPLWFLLELFFVSLVLLLLKKIDKNDYLWKLAGKANLFILFFLVLPFWGSSFLLNTPLITTFRNGIYLFIFLAGYYFFTHDEILQKLTTFRFPLLTAGIILGGFETYYFYGEMYAGDTCLQHPLTNLYSWVMMLAIVGFARKHFNKTNKFLDYLKGRSFYWYLCHYPFMAYIAYLLMNVAKFSMVYNYILLLIIDIIVTVVFCEIVRLVPILRFLLFGMKKNKR
jgi:hypothetical protein